MKRALDIVLAGLGLILLSPLLGLLALVVAATMGRPVLFSQVRPGLNARPFRLYKFRTMRNAVDDAGASLSDVARLTRTGRFLRASSLDELPELWNILRGDMSLVGPRPLLMEYLPMYSAEQAKRHEVRPGMTGWAQINGRNTLSWKEKFALDVWYVDNRTMMIDLKILAQTVIKVVRRDGISAEGEATMTRFDGNQS